MVDVRQELRILMEDALCTFMEQRIRDIGISETWRESASRFSEQQKAQHYSDYQTIIDFCKTHDPSELSLRRLDVTALTALIFFCQDFEPLLKLYNPPQDNRERAANTGIKQSIERIRNSRNALIHYPVMITSDNEKSLWIDQLIGITALLGFEFQCQKYLQNYPGRCLAIRKAMTLQDKLRAESYLQVETSQSVDELNRANFSDIILDAENGVVEAQLKVAKAYRNGGLVPIDEGKAFYWFNRAAKGGNPEALYWLARFYASDAYSTLAPYRFDKATGQDSLRICSEQFRRLMQLSAEKGCASAQCYLANELILSGQCNRTAAQQGYEWAKKAADQNDPEGIRLLSLCYDLGIHVAKDPDEANRLFQLAVDLGSELAILREVREAEKSKDYEKAYFCYSRLVSLGYDKYSDRVRDTERRIKNRIGV